MKNFFKLFFDILLPPSDDQRAIELQCPLPTVTPHSWQASDIEIVSLFPYHDEIVQAHIRAAKFNGNKAAHAALGLVLASYLTRKYPNHFYIPIPLSPQRLRERGYNQVEAILNAGHCAYQQHILARSDRPPQTSLERSARLENLKGSFSLRATSVIVGANVVLIDDVATTGTTLKTAHDALLEAKPQSITCLSIAH